MTNPILGEAPLKLKDGRTFTLVLDFEAMVAAESAYGKPIAQTLADADVGFLGATRALLFGALRAYHKDVDLAGASAIYVSNGSEVVSALEAASAASRAKRSEDKESGKAPRPRGKNSGRNGVKRA